MNADEPNVEQRHTSFAAETELSVDIEAEIERYMAKVQRLMKRRAEETAKMGRPTGAVPQQGQDRPQVFMQQRTPQGSQGFASH